MLDKWQNMLEELKKQDRCTAIHLWHKNTLNKMKLNLIQLRKEMKIYVQ